MHLIVASVNGNFAEPQANTTERLTLADVGQLLWAAQGVTSPDGKRTAPSAMHRYPLEIVIVAQNVDGLPCGALSLCAGYAFAPIARRGQTRCGTAGCFYIATAGQ